MAIDKKSNLFSVLQSDYAAWLSQFILSVFYEDTNSRQKIIPPQSFRKMYVDVPLRIPSRVQDAQDVLHEMADTILMGNGIPSKEKMSEFLMLYDSFHTALQRMNQDYLLADYGVDVLTGLRSSSVMLADLERELERRARRGQPFCIVLSRIDGESERKNPDYILTAAKCIEGTIRNFDDAYVTDEGEFLSCLKHSDDKGGMRFIARLNDALVNIGGGQITMSSFVAEPLPGDNISQLIENIRVDLNQLAQQTVGASGQYEDESPLSRYVRLLKDEKKE